MTQVTCISLFILCCSPLLLLGQLVELNGVIELHNSKYQTGKTQFMSNVLVEAPLSKPTLSDSKGRFRLTFIGVKIGETTKLNVKKAGYEVVNSQELENIVLRREEVIKIILAPQGSLDEAKMKYYNIAQGALYKSYVDRVSSLTKDLNSQKKLILQLENELNITINNKEEAIEVLRNQLNSAEDQIPIL